MSYIQTLSLKKALFSRAHLMEADGIKSSAQIGVKG